MSVAAVLADLQAAHEGMELSAEQAETVVALVNAVVGDRRARTGWDAVLGPVVPSGVAAQLLGVSRAGLDRRRNAGTVLGVRTTTGRWMYPLAQFRGKPGGVRVLRGLPEVLQQLLTAGDQLAAARWLATPNRRLEGATPWHALEDVSAADRVVAAARAQCSAWLGR